MYRFIKHIGLIPALLSVPSVALGEISLPKFFTDNMIVQQQSVLTVPVTASPQVMVTVSASWGESVSGTTDRSGKVSLRIPTPEAGGPYSITVTAARDTIRLINVLSGEVWLCSGQSNMEFPANGWTHIMNHDEVIGCAHRPDIRLLQIKDVTAFTPQDDTDVTMGGWVECNSASMQDFSAIAYLFAARLHEELGLPVGVIDCAWGGTPAEAWTSAKALGAVPGFEGELELLDRAGGDRSVMEREWNELRDQRMAEAYSRIKPFDKGVYQTSWSKMPVPGYWESTVAPNFDGIMSVQTVVSLSLEEAASPIEISLGAIDDEDITYVNGKEAVRGSGFATPRHYKISPELLREGENVITVQITDTGGEGGFGGKADEMKVVTSQREIPLAGEWAYNIGVDFADVSPMPASYSGASFPSVLYNAMLSPLHVMPIKGVLWYQGCANVGRDEQYEPLFKALINDWRSLWGYDMPFYFVQLAGWLKAQPLQPDSPWAALRNAQSKALELSNTSMVTAIDLGNPADIHPRNKQEVARRLAETALSRDYGKDYDYEAPKCISVKTSERKLILTFDSALSPKSVAVTGFIIGDADGNFAVAAGRLTDDRTIELTASEIAVPVSARYNWADYPGGNVYGSDGLPVAPFATDK